MESPLALLYLTLSEALYLVKEQSYIYVTIKNQ